MSRAKHLFSRFGTLQEQLSGETKPMERVNRAASAIMEAQEKKEQKTEVNEQEDEEDSLNLIDRVQGIGSPEGHGKAPTYALHGPDYVQFAALTQDGIPFVAVMPRLSTTNAIAWINHRIKGFKDNPKSRESVEESIRRKAIAAMGEDFHAALRREGGDMVNAELETMFNPSSHSGIGDLDLLSKKANKVDIDIDVDGNVSGISFGYMKDGDGKILTTADYREV